MGQEVMANTLSLSALNGKIVFTYAWLMAHLHSVGVFARKVERMIIIMDTNPLNEHYNSQFALKSVETYKILAKRRLTDTKHALRTILSVFTCSQEQARVISCVLQSPLKGLLWHVKAHKVPYKALYGE